MKNVKVSTLKNWLNNNEAVLIDVREPTEHEAIRITDAQLNSLSQFDHQGLKQFSNKKIVLHCKSGKRSLQACERLLEMAPELEIYNLEGGIEAWQQANFPTQEAANTSLPLQQQVQIIVGIFVILLSILAYFYGLFFTALLTLMGIGLIFSGISGSCAMAKLIAKMPWNRVLE